MTPLTKAELSLPGRPITKKNSQRIVYNRGSGKPMVIQSEPYRLYADECLWRLKGYRGPTFAEPVKLTARYYMPNRRSWPDLMGLLQATCDILEAAGVLEDDALVKRLDGSEIAGVDRDQPRADVVIATWRGA